MQQELHYHERINAGSDIINHNPSSFGKSLQLPHRRRFQNIEATKKYKAHDQGFPRDRSEQERNPLAGDFIDNHDLRVLEPGCSRDCSCRRNAECDDDYDQRAQKRALKIYCNDA